MKVKLTAEQIDKHQRQIWAAGGIPYNLTWHPEAAFWLKQMKLQRLFAQAERVITGKTDGPDRLRNFHTFHECRDHLRNCVFASMAPLPGAATPGRTEQCLTTWF